jgi:hypothetical protein
LESEEKVEILIDEIKIKKRRNFDEVPVGRI